MACQLGSHGRKVRLMKLSSKLGIVAAVDVAAFVIASGVVAAYIASTNGPDRQTYAAMYDFGDSLLFLAVFGLIAIPATAAGLFFLRPYRKFWFVLSVTALAIATTCVAALAIDAAPHIGYAGWVGQSWLVLASLRILIAPLFAFVFLLSGVFAPSRSTRMSLILAMLIEASAFGLVITWFPRLTR